MTRWTGQPDYFDDSGVAAAASWNIGAAGGQLLEALSTRRPREVQTLCERWAGTLNDLARICTPAEPSTSTSVALGDARTYADHLMVAAAMRGYPEDNIEALAWSMVHRDHAERFYAWLSLNAGCAVPSMIKPLPPPVINWPQPASADAPKPETAAVAAGSEQTEPVATVHQFRPRAQRSTPPMSGPKGGAAA